MGMKAKTYGIKFLIGSRLWLKICKLKWTESGIIGVHFCIVFMLSTPSQYTTLPKTHFFARIISCPPFLIHCWTFEWKNFHQIQIFHIGKSLNEFSKFWGSKKYLNAIPIFNHILRFFCFHFNHTTYGRVP
jgi:hypothetical protein